MPAAATPFNGGGVSLRFPREVGTDEVPNYVTFRPTIVDYGFTNGKNSRTNYGNARSSPDFKPFKPGPTVGSQSGAGVTFFNPFNSIVSQIGGFVESISKQANLSFNTPFGNVGFDLGAGAAGGSILSGRLNLGLLNIDLGNNRLAQELNTIRKLPGIHLYLPSELRNSVVAQTSQTNIGAVGQEAINFVSNEFDSRKTGDLISGMAAAALQDILPDQMTDAVQVGLGRAKNNYSYAIFQGMRHREFSYNFTLIAKDAAESKQIKQICDSFIFYMLPMRSPDTFHFFDVPCMWEISYNRLGKEMEYIDQPNNCFLTSANVTYGKGAFGQTHDNGAPLSVDLELKFMELEPLVRGHGDRGSANTALLDQVMSPFRTGANGGDGGGVQDNGA